MYWFKLTCFLALIVALTLSVWNATEARRQNEVLLALVRKQKEDFDRTTGFFKSAQAASDQIYREAVQRAEEWEKVARDLGVGPELRRGRPTRMPGADD
jgi:hypothetical protein